MWLPIGNTIIRCGNNGGVSAPTDEELALPVIEDGNTVAWYDYQDLTTLTDDGGGLISSWRDKLLSGHDLTAATTARPTLTADGILFNGTDNAMKTSAFTWTQPEFIYMVFRQKTWTDPKHIFDGDANNSGTLFQSTTTPNIALYAGSVAATNSELTLDAFAIVRILFDGASSKVIVNASTPTTGNCGASNMGGFTLACQGNTAVTFSNIEVKEVICRNIVDSGADEILIYNYLKTKYSL